MSHTANVLRLKVGSIDIKSGVDDIFADMLDAEIDKQMEDIIGDWNAYKAAKQTGDTSATGPESVAKVSEGTQTETKKVSTSTEIF